MSDDLSTPLGKKKPKRWLPKISINPDHLPIGRILVVLLLVALSIPLLRIAFVDDPGGGKPVAIAAIGSDINTNPVAESVSAAPERPAVVSSNISVANGPEITIVDDINLEPDQDSETADHLRGEFGAFQDLSEDTQYGIVPRISPLGKTPFATYSRVVEPQVASAGLPRIAIIVTGLGLSETGTLDAITKLPQNVTLAFAPHARTLVRTVATARTRGFELMLEVPMEPFDYPSSDPGPRTLLVEQPARTNLDNLTWVMARIGGYVGLINYQGARFTSSAADLAPIMEELGTRGLGYIDDGSSNRSLSRQLAEANRVPFGRASALLDANPSRTVILSELEKLETLAKEQGGAIGVISALPVSIDALVSWAASLQDRQMVLVPASALMETRP